MSLAVPPFYLRPEWIPITPEKSLNRQDIGAPLNPYWVKNSCKIIFSQVSIIYESDLLLKGFEKSPYSSKIISSPSNPTIEMIFSSY